MRNILVLLIICNPYSIYSQNGSGKDSTAFLDSIYAEMDGILDQMLAPKSFVSVSLGAGTGFYNFKTASTTQLSAERKLLVSPSVNYFHKSGFGIGATGFMINDSAGLNAYQFSVTPSYDLIRRGKFATGIAFTRYFTKDNLLFYTTPIQNEAYAYFIYRKWWIQPGVSAAYGWGSRTQLEERKVELVRLRRRTNPTIVTIQNDESVNDFSTLFSVRHDFRWSGIAEDNDLLSFTPIILLSAGTQSFGFNTSYQSTSKTARNFLPSNQYIKHESDFDVQSTTLILRGDYSTGMFFIQPQILLDYSLKPADKRLNNAVAIVAGINL